MSSPKTSPGLSLPGAAGQEHQPPPRRLDQGRHGWGTGKRVGAQRFCADAGQRGLHVTSRPLLPDPRQTLRGPASLHLVRGRVAGGPRGSDQRSGTRWRPRHLPVHPAHSGQAVHPGTGRSPPDQTAGPGLQPHRAESELSDPSSNAQGIGRQKTREEEPPSPPSADAPSGEAEVPPGEPEAPPGERTALAARLLGSARAHRTPAGPRRRRGVAADAAGRGVVGGRGEQCAGARGPDAGPPSPGCTRPAPSSRTACAASARPLRPLPLARRPGQRSCPSRPLRSASPVRPAIARPRDAAARWPARCCRGGPRPRRRTRLLARVRAPGPSQETECG